MRPARNLRTGSLALWLVALVLSSTFACGPVEYINQVGNKAAGAVSAAKLAQADKYSPYEYTAAEEYLHKAREEAGHAEYEDAIEYGRRAEELADRARAITVEKLAREADARRYTPKSENEEPKPPATASEPAVPRAPASAPPLAAPTPPLAAPAPSPAAPAPSPAAPAPGTP